MGDGGQNNPADVVYASILLSLYENQGAIDPGAWLICVPPNEEEGPPGICTDAALARIKGISPGGLFAPNDPGFRKLEVQQLIAVVSTVPEDAAALIIGQDLGEITGEEEDDSVADPIGPTTVAINAIQGYLNAMAAWCRHGLPNNITG